MWWMLVACGEGVPGSSVPEATGSMATDVLPSGPYADVVSVTASGADGAWTVAVGLRSEETGCDQYANWWEVLRMDGTLVYRRILDHSHPDEQPFVRDGGPVAVRADEPVVVRGHMVPTGYGGALMSGTLGSSFSAWEAPDGFGADLEDDPPLPTECLF